MCCARTTRFQRTADKVEQLSYTMTPYPRLVSEHTKRWWLQLQLRLHQVNEAGMYVFPDHHRRSTMCSLLDSSYILRAARQEYLPLGSRPSCSPR